MDSMDHEAGISRIDAAGLSQVSGSSEPAWAEQGMHYALDCVLDDPTRVAFGVIALAWVVILLATVAL